MNRKIPFRLFSEEKYIFFFIFETYSHDFFTLVAQSFVNHKLALSSQLWIGICQEHLPTAEQQQQGHLPSASAETDPWAAATADLQHPLRAIQGGGWGALFQTGGKDL